MIRMDEHNAQGKQQRVVKWLDATKGVGNRVQAGYGATCAQMK